MPRVLALALLLALSPLPHPAQAAGDAFAAVPRTDPAYRDLAALHQDGILSHGASGFFQSTGGRATRYNFALIAADLFGVLEDDQRPQQTTPLGPAALQSQFLQRPSAVAALSGLAAEFRPGLASLGVNLTAAHLRLAALSQGRALPIVPPFADVPKSHWAYHSVQTLRQAGIIIGFPTASRPAVDRE